VARRDDREPAELRPWQLGARLFTGFGALALIVAAVGVYSVIAYAVSQRTNEGGIRIALGAATRNIVIMVLGEGLRIVTVGVLLGLTGALALGKVLSALLYAVGPRDSVVLIGASVTLSLTAILACAIPAMRAARVDPMIALRSE
jgi:ABC-type antimicrobial peptide transport system permease subunit